MQLVLIQMVYNCHLQLLCLIYARSSGKLHFTTTPVDPSSAPSKIHIMYLWWSCAVLPRGPVCVHVASTFTSYLYIILQKKRNVHNYFMLFLIKIDRCDLQMVAMLMP